MSYGYLYASNMHAYTTILLYERNILRAAVAQSVRAFAPQAEGWVFEYQLRQTSSDSTTAKRSAIHELTGVSVTGPRG